MTKCLMKISYYIDINSANNNLRHMPMEKYIKAHGKLNAKGKNY